MGISRVYVDANIFIKLFEGTDEISALLAEVLAAAPARAMPPFASSELSLAEVLVAPIRNSDAPLVAAYEASLGTGAAWQIYPVSREVLRRAAKLRAARRAMKLPDAIHVSAAIESGCSHMLSGDLRLRDLLQDQPLSSTVALTFVEPTHATLSGLREWLTS